MEWRDNDYAIYRQMFREDRQTHGFEVFEIKKTIDHVATIAGVEVLFKAKEHYPADNDFGITAFHVKSIERWKEKIQELRQIKTDRINNTMNPF